MSTADKVEADSHVLPRQFRPGRCKAASFERYAWDNHSSSATIGSHLSMEEHDVELRPEAASPQNRTGCPPWTLHPTEGPHVFAAIGPMAAPARHLLAKPLFVDVHSRRLKSSSAVTPCSQLWPMLVNEERQWWQLPELQPAEAPAAAARGEEIRDVLYTAEQLEGWRRAVTFPDERETVPSVLAAGLCRQSTGCPWMEHVDSSFSLSRLEKQVEGGMWHLLVPEPLNSLTNHLQSIIIFIMGCVMLRWGCQSNAPAAGAAAGPTQVNVEVAARPPPAESSVPGALAALEYQSPQAAALMAAATAALKQRTE